MYLVIHDITLTQRMALFINNILNQLKDVCIVELTSKFVRDIMDNYSILGTNTQDRKFLVFYLTSTVILIASKFVLYIPCYIVDINLLDFH